MAGRKRKTPTPAPAVKPAADLPPPEVPMHTWLVAIRQFLFG